MGSSASIPHSKHCAFFDFTHFQDSKRAGDGQLRCTCSRRTRALRRSFLKARARRTDSTTERGSSAQKLPFSPIICIPDDFPTITTRKSSSSRSRPEITRHQLQVPASGFSSSSRSSSPSRSSTSGSTGTPSTPGSASWYSSSSGSGAISSPDCTPQSQRACEAGQGPPQVRPVGSPTLGKPSQPNSGSCCGSHTPARCSSEQVGPDVLIGGARWLAARLVNDTTPTLSPRSRASVSAFDAQAGARTLLKREFAAVKALGLLDDKVEIQIAAFLNLFAANVKLDDHLFVLAFVLLERLAALPGHRAVTLTRRNWRSVLITALTIALKVQLDDIRVTNKDICQLFPLFHPKQLNEMENEYLQRVNWATYVSGSTWEAAFGVFHDEGSDIRVKLGTAVSEDSSVRARASGGKSRSASVDSCGATEFKECV